MRCGRDALRTAGGLVLSEVEGMPALPQSSADEVDDFQVVAFSQVGLCPSGSGDDVPVQLYGYTVLLHAELFDQQSQCDWGQGLFLPVDDYFHQVDSRN
jgi:hypothetical protein